MAVIPTPEQGKPILDFSDGTFDGNSNLFQSRNGATEHVNGDDVADYVNTSRIYNGLETASKTPVGAINEIKDQEESDIADVQAAIDNVVSKFGFDKIKSQTFTDLTVSANTIDTRDLTLTVPADSGILCGFSLSRTSNCCVLQCYFASRTTLHTRVLNIASQQDSYAFEVFYI